MLLRLMRSLLKAQPSSDISPKPTHTPWTIPLLNVASVKQLLIIKRILFYLRTSVTICILSSLAFHVWVWCLYQLFSPRFWDKSGYHGIDINSTHVMRHANLSRESDSFLISKPASFLINLLLPSSITVHDRVEFLHIVPHSNLFCWFFYSPQLQQKTESSFSMLNFYIVGPILPITKWP